MPRGQKTYQTIFKEASPVLFLPFLFQEITLSSLNMVSNLLPILWLSFQWIYQGTGNSLPEIRKIKTLFILNSMTIYKTEVTYNLIWQKESKM
jgi:hypothetical protein